MGHYQKFLRGQCFKKSSIFLLYFEHSKNSSKIFQQIMNSYFLMLYFAFVLGDNAFQKIVCKYRTGGKVFDFLVNCRDVLAISLKKNLCLTGFCIAIRYVTCKGLHHSLPLSLLIWNLIRGLCYMQLWAYLTSQCTVSDIKVTVLDPGPFFHTSGKRLVSSLSEKHIIEIGSKISAKIYVHDLFLCSILT